MQTFGKENHSSVSEFLLLGFSSEPQVRMALFIFFLLLYLITLLGNGLITTLIYLDSRLHTPMYFFLSILSMVDMSYVTTTVPQMLVNMLCPRRTISWGACVAQMFIFLVLGIAECVLYAIMAYDRIRSSQGRIKSFSTCASHITVVTMFYAPAMMMYMRPGSWYDPERDKKLALFYNVVSAFLNPIIYSLRNKDVKVAFLKVFGDRRTPQ
nr:olfactory receptor 11-like isoform X2 [Microcebus murinus]